MVALWYGCVVQPLRSAPSQSLDGDVEQFAAAVGDLLRTVQLRDRESICCHDVSVTECYALEFLTRREEASLQQVAEALRLDKSTTSRAVAALERKGYVARASDPNDRRLLRLQPTRRGVELSGRIRTDLDRRYVPLLADLEAPVRRQLIDLVRALAAQADCRCGPEAERE